ncbi:MAG: isocitrate/isopropylmalate family dehydrogenase [Thermomicrobiales bacterium]
MSRKVFRIAVVPGDGIGLEVTPVAVKVLDRLGELSGGELGFEYAEFPWGSHHYLETGRVMDEGGLEALRSFDAILFGATGWPTVPDHISLYGFRIAVCKGFDLFASVRPCGSFRIQSPLRRGTRVSRLDHDPGELEEYSGIGSQQSGRPRRESGDRHRVGTLHRGRMRTDHALYVRDRCPTSAPACDQRHQKQCSNTA